jgi:hypothetical protein
VSKKADYTLTVTPAESLMLWQLVNNPQVAAPWAHAAVAGALYAKARAAALEHGHVKDEPADGPESA